MTEYDRRLAYFYKFEQEILNRLKITQPADTLTDDDRAGLASMYLEIMAS